MEKQLYAVACCFLLLCCAACLPKPKTPIEIKSNQLKIGGSIPNDPATENFIQPFRQSINTIIDQPLSYTPKTLSKTDGQLESSLGNLVADLAKKQVDALLKDRLENPIDFVLLNFGGLRASIPSGTVSARNAFTVMPFENELVVVTLDYTKIRELVHYLARDQKAHPVSNLQLRIHKNTNQAAAIQIGNQPLDRNKTYQVLTTDYLQQGGDHMTFFKNPIGVFATNYKLRNAMIDYFKTVDTLRTTLDQRLRYVQ